MSQERKPRTVRWTMQVAVLVCLGCLAMPAWSADHASRTPTESGAWIEHSIERTLAYWRGLWHAAASNRPGAAATADGAAEQVRARQRHHLTIEPGGDALPPPTEGDAPGHG